MAGSKDPAVFVWASRNEQNQYKPCSIRLVAIKWDASSWLHSNLGRGHVPELRLEKVTAIERPHATGDVIFVHGLGGDGRVTWSAASDAFWPLWIFDDLQTINVWTLEYPASIFGSANGSLVISDQAKQVLDLLASHSIGKRPLVLVAHSLGGLLVKQLLRTAVELHKPDWEAIATSTKGVLFLATPHTGSSIASIASKFPLVS
jgi:pimeloyl-ACP methyl ester carboxylesterase